MLKRTVLFFLIIVILASFTSCYTDGISPDINSPELSLSIYNIEDPGDKGPVKGGTLKLFATDPDTLNPLSTHSIYTKDFLSLIYESLIILDPSQKPIPYLSDSWECSDDKMTWTFHLRDGISWHDGKPFTAYDVEYTLDLLNNQNIDSIYEYNIKNIASYAAIDEKEFRIVLKRPNSFTAELMTFPIVAKHIFSPLIGNPAADIALIGTGPYIFKSYEKNKSIKLEANDKWWNSKNPGNESLPARPYIDNIEIKIYKNVSAAAEAFQKREVDLLCIEGTGFEKYSARSDMVIKKYPGRVFDFIAFNCKSTGFSGSKLLRQAIFSALDREKIIETLFSGSAVVADLPVIPGTAMLNNEAPITKTDTERTLKLLESDGFKHNQNGYYKYINGIRKKLELELLVNDDNKNRIELASEISAQLAQNDIYVKVVVLKWQEIFNRISSGKFDMVLTGINIPSIPDISYLLSEPYLSSFNNTAAAAYNISGYSNSVISEYIDKIFMENDDTKKRALYINMKAIIDDELPYMGICFYSNAVVYNKRLRGSLNPNAWNKYNDITGWYIYER